MKRNNIASIIISAGFSSRMNGFKPFLKFGELTAIETVISTYQSAGIEDIYVVIGHNGNEIMEKLKDYNVKIIINHKYPDGMFSSIKEGIKALDEKIEAFYMNPVDIPLVKANTIKTLKSAYLQCEEGILYPVFNRKKGHPPIIASKYKEAILASDGEGGLKKILTSFDSDSIRIPVFDEATLMDMDTKEDYLKLTRYYLLNAPTDNECSAIIKYFNMPDHISMHCEAVARVALEIYNSIKDYCSLDENALFVAARLHDIARKEKNHAAVGAKLLSDIGYKKIGNIILTHMDIDINKYSAITENEILYLADKLVKENQVCSLDERFNGVLKENENNPQVLDKINKRLNFAKVIIEKIENLTGKGFIYG